MLITVKKVDDKLHVTSPYNSTFVAAAGSLTLEGLRHVFLMFSNWHHTSKYFNETDFYTIAENVTTDDIATYLQDRQAGKSALALLAKRTKYLRAHGWQVEHAAWTDAATYKPDTWLALSQVLGYLEYHLVATPSIESCTVEIDGIRTYSEQELHWLATHGKKLL